MCSSDLTDAKLRAALRSETANATVFVVAQRISTVIGADRIVVLDNGRVVGIGTHDTLIKTNEIYREIVASQVSLEEVACPDDRWCRTSGREASAADTRRPRAATPTGLQEC